MIISTTENIPGMKVVNIHGIVKGNAVRARHMGKDVLAVLRNVVGGEIREYTKMLAETREQALDRMKDEAKKLGANGIISVRFITAEIMSGAAELLAYGTAVTIKPEGT
jgi:uncharacterized protein YbjQ (UPF0145 family)